MTEPELFSSALRLILALAIVLGVLFALFYLLKKMAITPRNMGGRGAMQLMDHMYIGIKKNITVVKIPGSLLVLGVTNEQITLLATITDPETIKEFEVQTEKGRNTSFSQHMQKISEGFLKGRPKA